MKTSDSVIKISAAFVKAQGEITGAAKDSTNPAFKSRYADLASVTDAIRPAAARHGLGYLQDATMIEGGKLLLVTRIIHESGEFFEFEMTMPVTKLDVQGAGSVITYSRRYALSAAWGVAPLDDEDGNAASGVSARPASNYPAKAPYTPAKPATAPAKPTATVQAAAPSAALLAAGDVAAKAGIAEYQKFWTELPAADRTALGAARHAAFKAVAAAVQAK